MRLTGWFRRSRPLPLALIDLPAGTATEAGATAQDARAAVSGTGPGRLAITFLPGKRCDAGPGRAPRDLKADARRLRAHGVDVLLLLVEDHELTLCGVEGIVAELAAHGIVVVRQPIPDMGIPTDVDAFRSTLTNMTAQIAAGDMVAIACRGGLGRSGTTAACLLVGAGLEPAVAIERVRAARPGAIETPAQEAFVRRW